MQSLTSDTVYTPTINLPVRTIYWRVMSNLIERYSITDSFCIVNAMVTLVPFDKDSQYTQNPMFAWHTVPSATTYRIQIDTLSSFANPPFSILTNDTFYTPTANLPSGTIYGRVNSDAPGCVYSSTGTIIIIQSTAAYSKVTTSNSHGICRTGIHGRGILFTFNTHSPGSLTIRVFSPAGKLVATIAGNLDNQGAQHYLWDGRNASGDRLHSGTYFFEARFAGRTQRDRFIVTG